MSQDAAALPRDAAALPRASEALAPPPARVKRSPRKLILPLIVIAALAYGANWGYRYFVEGRFLVETDDAYVGADSVIVSPKITGYIAEVLVKNNQEVRAGDVLARIDDVDYKLALEAARDKVATQDATIARIVRQTDAQRAMVAQAAAQIDASRASADSAAADEQRASLEFDRAQKLVQTSFGSQQRFEQATADKKRTAAAARLAPRPPWRRRRLSWNSPRRTSMCWDRRRLRPNAPAPSCRTSSTAPNATSRSRRSALRSTA